MVNIGYKIKSHVDRDNCNKISMFFKLINGKHCPGGSNKIHVTIIQTGQMTPQLKFGNTIAFNQFILQTIEQINKEGNSKHNFNPYQQCPLRYTNVLSNNRRKLINKHIPIWAVYMCCPIKCLMK